MVLVLVLALAGLVFFLHVALRPERGADSRAARRLRELHRREAVERARMPQPGASTSGKGTGTASSRVSRMARSVGDGTRAALGRLVEPGVTGPGADAWDPAQQVSDLRRARAARAPAPRPAATGTPPPAPPGWAPHELDAEWAPPARPRPGSRR